MRMNIEQAKELRHSSLWQWVRGELEYRIDTQMQRLKTAAPENVQNIQKRIQNYEEMLSLPEDIVAREEA